MDVVYLDNNSTTRPAPEVVEAMLPYLRDLYGNPSSLHRFGGLARKAIDDARAAVATLIGCRESELVFTGGGTESVNTAIRGLLGARSPRRRIVTSVVEHAATRTLCQQLAREGFTITAIEVDREGLPDMDALSAALGDDVALATLIWANNETGVIFPMEQIAALCRAARVPIHADATQAVGKIPVNVAQAGIDVMTFAAHKFHGPKGVAGLFIRRGLRLRPLVIGGPQERERRGGTENVPGIVGMGKAAQLAGEFLPDMPRVARLRDRLERTILDTIPQTSLNGSPQHRLPNTSNISFAGLEAEAILLLLSEKDICASAGAACSSGSLEPSPVLLAMKIDPRLAHGAIRFSLSRYTTEAEVERALAVLPEAIGRLRKVMPVGERVKVNDEIRMTNDE
jgi:cysteine desulfurase